MRASSELQFGALQEVGRHCRGKSGSALSGGYAPGLAKAEGSSIVKLGEVSGGKADV